ncbi:Vmc-like lipoprotein signal peptide domain-containing protein [Nocardia sp. NPDC051750]|uniref:Vmc-like lipoprotein signal peptide domain-containing protein n=1 Tax=Nocardia sp. NPDC051750 TaxID=3364325 RepID=UPI00378D5633
MSTACSSVRSTRSPGRTGVDRRKRWHLFSTSSSSTAGSAAAATVVSCRRNCATDRVRISTRRPSTNSTAGSVGSSSAPGATTRKSTSEPALPNPSASDPSNSTAAPAGTVTRSSAASSSWVMRSAGSDGRGAAPGVACTTAPSRAPSRNRCHIYRRRGLPLEVRQMMPRGPVTTVTVCAGPNCPAMIPRACAIHSPGAASANNAIP